MIYGSIVGGIGATVDATGEPRCQRNVPTPDHLLST